MAAFYEMPELTWMLPVASLTVFINACNSPRAVLLIRDLELRKGEGISLVTVLSGIMFTVTLAILWGNAWALIVGGLFRDLFKCALSYLVCPPLGVRPCWNKKAVKEILVFGVAQMRGMPMWPVSASSGSSVLMSSGIFGSKVMCKSHVRPALM